MGIGAHLGAGDPTIGKCTSLPAGYKVDCHRRVTRQPTLASGLRHVGMRTRPRVLFLRRTPYHMTLLFSSVVALFAGSMPFAPTHRLRWSGPLPFSGASPRARTADSSQQPCGGLYCELTNCWTPGEHSGTASDAPHTPTLRFGSKPGHSGHKGCTSGGVQTVGVGTASCSVPLSFALAFVVGPVWSFPGCCCASEHLQWECDWTRIFDAKA